MDSNRENRLPAIQPLIEIEMVSSGVDISMSPLPRSQQSSIIVESLVPDPELLKDDDMVSERPSRSAESRTASPDRIAHTVMQKSRVMLSNVS